MEIEEVAKTDPKSIIVEPIDIDKVFPWRITLKGPYKCHC
jgi:hypothetical protein